MTQEKHFALCLAHGQAREVLVVTLAPQGLASCEQARRENDWRRGGGGNCRAEGSSSIGDGGQATVSPTCDTDGACSGSLLDSIVSTLSRK